MGNKTYGLLRNLSAPVKPSSLSLITIVETLQKHLSPKPLLIAERFCFHKRNQLEGETISTYIAESKKLTLYCEFGASLNDAIRDRLVCGLHSELIQKQLLSEPELTLAKATEIAFAMEAAAKDTLELQGSKEGRVVNRVVKNVKPKPCDNCYQCSGTTYESSECYFKNETCRKCGKLGHIQQVCRSGRNQNTTQRRKVDKPNLHSFEMSDERDDDSLVASLELNNVNQVTAGEVIWVTPKINGHTPKMEPDTGPPISTLPLQKYKEMFADTPLVDTKAILKTYSGEKMKPEGKLLVRVEHNNQRSHHKKTQKKLEKLLNEYSAVFQNEIGTLKSTKAKLTLKENSQPKFYKARPIIPYALKPKVEVELKCLEEEGILSKLNFSNWAMSIVPIVKPNDHEPLTSILNPKKGIPAMTVACLQRYALFLAGLKYSIEYKNTTQHGNADGLSHIPLKKAYNKEVADPAERFQVSKLEVLPVNADMIRQATKEIRRKDELTLQDGCLMWGSRVIIPPKYQAQLLELHEGHPGIVRMKALARSYIWWPGMDKEIEQTAKGCTGCQLTQNNLKTAPLHAWKWPARPWQRKFVDFTKDISRNMLDNEEDTTEERMSKVEALKAEKRKLKGAITRQLNELAGRVAGVSSGVEPISSEEIKEIKATLERLEKIKVKTFEILEELRTLYQELRNTEMQLKVEDEADESNERIEDETSTIHSVLISFPWNTRSVSPTSYSSNSNTSLPHRNGDSGLNNLERIRIPTFSGNKTEFQHWNATFTSCVDATAMSAQFKMLKLEACLAGEALETVKGLGYSETAYEVLGRCKKR
ncbi:Uncharacterized protein K02A2.6 [Stylophora pistillata]|uniref:Uncharacterized protein K02A2.6 n=1 Tax=Stylophora pistillata TaxID=50429 RepID=A0A2B4SFB0_STYPI|nr:Uncharacterized protein K02A2.6 [Stylophora pistillata]